MSLRGAPTTKQSSWIPWIVSLTLAMTTLACTKVHRTATPVMPKLYQQTYAATPNAIYYALRWALKTYGYPIAEEDLQNGIIKTRYVPVGATSHYIDVFTHKDFGVNGAYHQLEVRLVPKGGQTEVQVGSRIQAAVSPIYSSGEEEKLILSKVADYLRSQNAQVTNLGIQE